MTPAQQTALEALVNRPLTADEIAHANERNDGLLAATLTMPRINSRQVGIGTILAVMAPNGGQFLDALEAMSASMPNVKWALKLIEQGTLDVGMAETRQQFELFAEATPAMAAGINALLALAESAAPMPVDQVSAILNSEAV